MAAVLQMNPGRGTEMSVERLAGIFHPSLGQLPRSKFFRFESAAGELTATSQPTP